MSLKQARSGPRDRPASAWVSWLLLSAVMAACAPQSVPDAPDVLLVTVDTLRADRLGFMGYAPARTPALDGLASRGVVFTRAITPVPRTTPALASLHTGLWPYQHGSREVGVPIAAGTLLAEHLTDAGYWTIGVSANSTAGRNEGLDVGFAEFVGAEDIEARYGDRIYDVLRGTSRDGVGWADAVNDEALALAEAAPLDRPLMLWTFYFDPHFLYAPPSPWQDDVDADECWSLYEAGRQDPGIAGAVLSDVGGVATRALPACSALYDAEIAYTDDRIARLLERVAEVRGDRRRLIVFTADHGENLGEGGLFFEHGDNAHDAAIRVPLVFAVDGDDTRRPAPAVENTPVSLVDVAPTILGLLGLNDLGSTAGRDLSARLAGLGLPGASADRSAAPVRDHVVFAESASPMYHEAARHHLETGWSTICLHGDRFSLCHAKDGSAGSLYDRDNDPALERDVSADHPEALAQLLEARSRWPVASLRVLTAQGARFKLVRRPELSGGYRDILVDPIEDPTESVDLAATFPDETTELQRALDAWMLERTSPAPFAPDDELVRRLRSLGYIR